MFFFKGYQQNDYIMATHQKGINQSPGSIVNANALFDINSQFSGFPSQHHLLPFNGQVASVDPMKIDHQNLPPDSILEFSGPSMHEVTNTRLKNLINNRKNQKEQMQNFIAQQNAGNLYPDEPPLSPISARPRSNGAENFMQTAQSAASQNRTGNISADNIASNEESNYNNQSLEPTYEPLRNLPPPSPDSELSWRKNSSPSSLDKEAMQKDLENGHQENDKGTKNFLLANNHSNESLTFSESGQDSVNGYTYRTYFEAGNTHELRNAGIETYSNNTSGQESYNPSSVSKTPQKYISQNAQTVYNNHYYQNTSEIRSYPGSNQNDTLVSQNSYTPTSKGQNNHSSYSQQPSQSPASNDPLPSPYAQNQSSPYEQQPNGKIEVSSPNTVSKNSTIDVVSRVNKESSEQEHFLLNSTTSMNTYSNIINTFNVNASNFATSTPSVTLPAIASLFSSGHTVISSAADLGSQLKVSYSNPTHVTASPWPSGGSHPSHIDSGRNEEFCGLDASSLGGIFNSLIATSVSSPVPTTTPSDTGKSFATNTSEASWWEHLKTSVKLEVPPASPDCEVLENQSSSPSAISLPTSL